MGNGNMHDALEDVIRDTARKLPDRKKNAVLRALDDTEGPKLISEKKAADCLGISKTHLWRWRKGYTDEDFPFSVLPIPGGSGVKYDYNEVLEYVSSHMVPPGKQENATTAEPDK